MFIIDPFELRKIFLGLSCVTFAFSAYSMYFGVLSKINPKIIEKKKGTKGGISRKHFEEYSILVKKKEILTKKINMIECLTICMAVLFLLGVMSIWIKPVGGDKYVMNVSFETGFEIQYIDISLKEKQSSTEQMSEKLMIEPNADITEATEKAPNDYVKIYIWAVLLVSVAMLIVFIFLAWNYIEMLKMQRYTMDIS